MWKFLFGGVFILVGFFSKPVFASQYELSILAGYPNFQMPFVQSTVRNHLSLVSGQNGTDYTTALIYFAERNGISSTQTLQLIDQNFSSSLEIYTRALRQAAATSSIVVSPLGGQDPSLNLCPLFMSYPQTAFLLVYDRKAGKPCIAGNVLYVAALNAQLDDLGANQEFGQGLRLAVPAQGLSAPVDQGREFAYSSRGFGMAMVAGGMSELLRDDGTLTGAMLIDRYLIEKTEVLAKLQGKVDGGRALIKFNK